MCSFKKYFLMIHYKVLYIKYVQYVTAVLLVSINSQIFDPWTLELK